MGNFGFRIIYADDGPASITAKAYGDGFEDMERRVPNIELIKQLVDWEPHRNLSTMIADIAAEMQKEAKAR